MNQFSTNIQTRLSHQTLIVYPFLDVCSTMNRVYIIKQKITDDKGWSEAMQFTLLGGDGEVQRANVNF
jgi:hypothetical protein